jgi:hypothetical protein
VPAACVDERRRPANQGRGLTEMGVQADNSDIRLTFRPLADDVPVPVRLRRLLKTALRQLRLKCTKVEDVPAGLPAVSGDCAAERKPEATAGEG